MDDLTPLNLPLYPNVFERGWTDGGDAAVLALTGKAPDPNRTRIAQMTSHDSFDMVYAWYRAQMPHGSESEEAAALNHTNDDGDRVARFEVGDAAARGYKRVMVIGKKGGDTTISLAGKVSG